MKLSRRQLQNLIESVIYEVNPAEQEDLARQDAIEQEEKDAQRQKEKETYKKNVERAYDAIIGFIETFPVKRDTPEERLEKMKTLESDLVDIFLDNKISIK